MRELPNKRVTSLCARVWRVHRRHLPVSLWLPVELWLIVVQPVPKQLVYFLWRCCRRVHLLHVQCPVLLAWLRHNLPRLPLKLGCGHRTHCFRYRFLLYVLRQLLLAGPGIHRMFVLSNKRFACPRTSEWCLYCWHLLLPFQLPVELGVLFMRPMPKQLQSRLCPGYWRVHLL